MSASNNVVQGGFTYVEVEHCLEVLDDNSTTFTSTHLFTVKAEIPSRFFVRSYVWTGTDETDTPELECTHDIWGHPVQSLHGPVIREGHTRIVLIDLGRTLQPGDIEKIQIRHHLRDFEGTFQPRLGLKARPGMQKFRLTVVLPDRLSERVIYRESKLDSGELVDVEVLRGQVLGGLRTTFTRSVVNPVPNNRVSRVCWGDLVADAPTAGMKSNQKKQ